MQHRIQGEADSEGTERFAGSIRPVVILISGWGAPGFEWNISPIPGRLRECGYDVVRANPCNFGMGDIEHQARTLAWDFAEQYYEYADVHLIGHSMGGLVATEAIKYGMFRSITTLGTPHQGTSIAKWTPRKLSESAWQMRPDSNITRRLKTVSHTPIFSVASKTDALIWPRASAIHSASIKTMWTNLGHVGLIYSKKIANSIVDFYKSLPETEEIE